MSKLTSRHNSYYEISELWGRENINLSQAHVLKIIGSLLDSIPKKNMILDAGCGDGLISTSLKKIRPDLNIVGIDSSYNAISHLPQKGLLGICTDISTLPFPDDLFSITWCMDVFEHLPPRVLKNALSELKRVTNKYLLIVTPLTESDSIVVCCPNCVTIFNPYHHVNCFNIARWLLLLDRRVNISFIPMGNLKSNLPARGLRKHTVLDELYVPVDRTQCPLCQEIFCVRTKSNMDLNGSIASYATENKRFFGNRFEELGVLLDLSFNQTKPPVQINFKSDEPDVKLHISSINHINFSDPSYAKNTMELFNQGGFYLISEAMNILLNEGCYFIQHHGIENRALIVLHPSSTQNHMNLILKFKDNSPGILYCSLFDRISNNYYKFQEIQCVGDGLEKNKEIIFDVSTNHITPYGILLEITCIPESDTFGLELLTLIDNEFQEQVYPLIISNDTLTINRLDSIDNKRLTLQFLEKKPEKLKLFYQNIKYDVSHLLTCSEESLFLKIPRTLLTDINEMKSLHIKKQNLKHKTIGI